MKRKAKKRTRRTRRAPADQVRADPPGEFPSKANQFKPGQSGNPAGRPSAGASAREWLNAMADLTEAEVRAVARNPDEPLIKRGAAERLLRLIEAGDLADMDAVLAGEMTLAQLRDTGVNTEVVKKLKVKVRTLEDGTTEMERELELHDRAGDDFDRVCDRTDGRPRQSVDLSGELNVPTAVEIITPLTRRRDAPTPPG